MDKPRVVKLKTESEEGPVNVLMDDEVVLTLDLKATPGVFHVVVPQKYRMKEVPHTSPQVGEGTHYAVMLDYPHMEKQYLKHALEELQERNELQQRIIDATAQQGTTNKSEKKDIPPLLEVWNEETGTWSPEYWLNLDKGMRCRLRHTLSGELRKDPEGHIDWTCRGKAAQVDGVWVVGSEHCDTNFVDREPSDK